MLRYCDTAFNFNNDFSTPERQQSLLGLMNCPSGPVHPLLEDEKQRIAGEFTTFILHAENQIKSDTQISQTTLWYELLTTVDCFNFALKFLNRSLNEGVVEVEVSNLENINSKKRPLKYRNVETLNFISLVQVPFSR